jgi:hypothetical protein
VFGPGEAKLSEIVRNADAACYAAKHGGRNRVHVHEALPKRSAERNGERNGDRSTERGTDRSTSARHS